MMKEISGDISTTYRPSVSVKLWYLLYNLVRGVAGGFSFVRTYYFHPKDIATDNDHSPMRILTDAVFDDLIKEFSLEKRIDVLDIGAGSAYFRERLAQLGYHGTYTGVDVYQHRAYRDDAVTAFNSELVISPIEEFTSEQKFHLIMSVTALEHIPDDFKAIEVAKSMQATDGIQIHIVPGFWSLFLYLLHGYRQYNRKRLGKLFAGQSYKIYRLGGLPSFLVHLFCITIPERILNAPVRHKPFYPRLVTRALKLDRYLPICGYAFVVIAHYTKV